MLVVALAAASLGLVACGSSGTASSTTGSTASPTTSPPQSAPVIVIKNFAFSPKSITVRSGTTITIKNEDQVTHTVTAINGSFNSGDIPAGQTGHVTVSGSGTVPYRCTIHPFMQASITIAG